jgi:hypothetical protein
VLVAIIAIAVMVAFFAFVARKNLRADLTAAVNSALCDA